MRVLIGTISFYEQDHDDFETKAVVYDAEWKEMTEEELNNYSGDWITEGYQGTIIIHSYLKGFFL